jgi:carboxypeptidase Taq
MRAQAAYDELLRLLRERAILASVSELLSWDEETMMPRGGAEHRSRQQALLAGLQHERAAAPRLGELLDELEQDASAGEVERANLRLARRMRERAVKTPRALVEESARVTTLSQEAWREARRADDFGRFRPWLEKVLQLKRDEAMALGPPDALYDTLLDEFEPGFTSAQLESLFVPLERELRGLLESLRENPRKTDPSLLRRSVPEQKQRELLLEVLRAAGFTGRLDTAAHPSTLTVGPGDVRITLRFSERDCSEALLCALHELGHWLYETNLPAAQWGGPAAEALSLGLHESQARLFENMVGRGRAFWTFWLSRIRRAFAPALDGATLEGILGAVTHVQPSLVRVHADEVTYNLHVLLRYRLERALVEGSLRPAELPAAWNFVSLRSLGLVPRTDNEGCLQDGHWSAGMFGYFPAYALGNAVAAQLFAAARTARPEIEPQLAEGNFSPLTSWLREHVHSRGTTLPLGHRVQEAAGAPLGIDAYLAYLRERYLSGDAARGPP